MEESTTKKPWKPVLYEKQSYPDNYTDDTFLQRLRKNVNLVTLTYEDATVMTGLFAQELCVVVLFVSTFVLLLNELVYPASVVGCICSVCALLYFLSGPEYGFATATKKIIFYFGVSYLVSPTIKTLTESISTDTIYSTTAYMFVLHLICFQYGVDSFIVRPSLSLMSAVFASVCLASRLPTSNHVFALIITCVACFAFAPVIISKFRSNNCRFKKLLFWFTALLLTYISLTCGLCFSVLLLFLNCVVPKYWVDWYKYKSNIHGPWDEAVVKLTDINWEKEE